MITLGRAYHLYLAIAFVVLIPVMTYKVFVMGLPKVVLLFCIPGYGILAVGFYQIFKNSKPK